MPSIPLYRHVPWFVKIPAKITLSRLPLPYKAWRCLGVFRHGSMADVDYAYRVFRGHLENSGMAARSEPFTMLELGPGDSALSAVFAFAHGAQRSVLVDVATCAEDSPIAYVRAAQMLTEQRLPAPRLDGCASLEAICKKCGADYLTDGLSSLRSLASESFDFIWSHAVLEHVRRDEFAETLRQLHRILKPDGVASHCVDLRDHLGGRLNNLRFSEGLWESPAFGRSGFYTNRIRFGEMLRLFEEAGFANNVRRVRRWNAIPTPRSHMVPAFRSLPDEDLRVMGFDVVQRRRIASRNAA